jgi:uncharacterized protein YcfJ
MIVRFMAGLMQVAFFMLVADGAVSAPSGTDRPTRYAAVLGVTPVMRALRTSRQTCRDVEVQYITPQDPKRNSAGAILGALFGGLLGSQIGSGDGRLIATVAGAASGGYAGYKLQRAKASDDVFKNIERSCTTTLDVKEELVGFDVRYRVGAIGEAVVRTNYDPGTKIPLRNGKVVLDGKTRE